MYDLTGGFQSESCISVNDVVNYNSCWTDSICQSSETIENEIACNIELVEQIIGRRICPEIECKVFSGSGQSKLFLKEKIISLASIEYVDCDPVCDCEEPSILPKIDYRTIYYDCCNEIFPCGDNNIIVCGTWGENIPCNLKKVIILMTLENLNEGLTGIKKVDNPENVSWGDFSINYGSPVKEITGLTTGYFDLDIILEAFIDGGDQITYGVVGDGSCSCEKNKNCGDCNC